MAETFNPIISHLYSGQGGVSREITKYNNGTISEINVRGMQVVKNPDFSQGVSDYWTSINATVGQETGGITITNNNNSMGQFLQYIDVVEGHTYLFKYTCYRSGGDSTSNPLIYPTSNLGNIRSYDIPTSMSTVEFTYVVPSGVNYVTARFFMSGTSCTIHCRGIYAFDLTAVKYDFGGMYNEKMFTGNRVWKQLFDYSSVSSVSANGVTITNNNDGSFTVYTDENGATANTMTQQYWINLVGDHKYAIVGIPNGASSSTYGISGTDNIYTNSIRSYSGDYARAFSICVFNGAVITTPVTFRPQIFDLTLIYGAGNEPTTIAEFVHDYPEIYYPYDVGTNFSLATKLFNTIKQPLDSIKFYGNTMRWCQLVHNGNFSEGLNYWGEPTYGSFTVVNGKGVYTVTTVGDDYQNRIATASTITVFKKDHKYLVCCTVTPPQNKSYVIRTLAYGDNQYILPITSLGTASSRTFLSAIATASANGTTQLRYTMGSDSKAVDDVITFENCQYFDLTYIFGAGNEPTTVSDFTRRLKKLYYPFTNGEILSVEKASEYLYGINIWDEEWEEGSINNSGQFAPTATIRSKNYTKVIPNTVYYITNKNFRICYYDENKVFISRTVDEVDNVFTTPENCEFIKITGNVIYGTTYNNDICVNLYDSSINGTYEASKGEQKIQLDSFNVWDEQWEVGQYDTATGAKVENPTNIRSKNFTRVLPSTEYYFQKPTTQNYGMQILFYDADKTFMLPTYSPSVAGGFTFTTPANCCYITFFLGDSYGTTYNNDICINLSDPSRNGIYVPYRGYVELNGINDVIDTVTVEKNVTLPFGLVDLGELTWYYLEASGHEAMYSTGIQSSAKHPSSDSTVANIVCGAFSTVTRNQQYNHSADFIIAMNTDGTLFVYSTTMGTTGALFKNSVKGKYLYYELADHPLNDTPILAGSYVKSAGTVDMGTLDWNYNSDRQAFYATISDAVDYTNSVLCAKYPTVQMSVIWTGAQDKVCSMQNNYIGPSYNKRIVVRDTSYTDATTFKASVQGDTLCYELATPVETTLTAQQCAEILNGAFTKSRYSTLLIDNDNGQIDQTVDVGMWEQR